MGGMGGMGMGGMGMGGMGMGGMGMGGMGMGMGISGAGGFSNAPPPPAANRTNYLCLENLVKPDELQNDDDYRDIIQDVQEECAKHGMVEKVIIPRPKPGVDVLGLGKAFVYFLSDDSAGKAQLALHGRIFDGNKVGPRSVGPIKVFIARAFPTRLFTRDRLRRRLSARVNSERS